MTEQPFEKHEAFLVRRKEPLNGGPPLNLLAQSLITPTPLFYVRNHGPVPQVDPAAYRLAVTGLVRQQLALTLDELRSAYPSVTLSAALQCAGNRRSEFMAVRPIPHELPWAAEAVGNATWTGVLLRDVLEAAGLPEQPCYVSFMGLDQVQRHGQNVGFGGSIPLQKALSSEVLLAYEMNGQALEPAHGFPLRVLVPGYIGARSVKWLAEVRVQEQHSDNYFQAKAYKLFAPHITSDSADWDVGLMLSDFPVNSVICEPEPGALLPAGEIELRGYALAGGGRPIARVDVSPDGGQSWVTAELQQEQTGWAWSLWQARLALVPGEYQLVARAVDAAANAQPERPEPLWNFKGYLNNAWHRVSVRVE